MDFTRDYSRVSAFSWGDEEEDDGSSRDPELEEEFMSRDWPEVSKPMKGGKLIWRKEGDFGGGVSHGGHFDTSGPRWYGTPGESRFSVRYEIWSEREFHEDWRGDYYTYTFTAGYAMIPQPIKGKKKQEKQVKSIGVGYGTIETLAEAQKLCEEHFRDNFGD